MPARRTDPKHSENEVAGASVLVVGDVMIDIVVKPDGPIAIGSDTPAPIRILPGGSGANQAVWLATCGVRTKFAGRVGRADHAAQAALLSQSDVHPVLAADELVPTGTLITLISPDGERSFLTDRGANERLCHDDLPPSLLDDIDLLHVSGYALFSPGPRAAVIELMDNARRRNIPVSVDPASYSFLQQATEKAFLAWTKGARLCFANELEAAVLAGTDDREAQLDSLSRHYGIVAIKLGGDGAMAASGQERWFAPAPAVDVVDSTGAGDAFLAGFLSGYLKGEDIEACLKLAVGQGSEAVTRLGARPIAAPAGEALLRFS